MRAGDDIGYCDSDYRDGSMLFSHDLSEEIIRGQMSDMGFRLEDVQLGEYMMQLYLCDTDTGVLYDFFDLEIDIYESFTRKDFLKEYDERWSPCCGEEVKENDTCTYCKKNVINNDNGFTQGI